MLALVPEEPPRLACRRLDLGRRDGHQFPLDRHRDRQCRPSRRAAGLSRRADRSADRALPGDRGAASHPAPPRARPFRRGAGPQARSGRALSLGSARGRAGIGHWVEPAAIAEGALLQAGDSGERVQALQLRPSRRSFAARHRSPQNDGLALLASCLKFREEARQRLDLGPGITLAHSLDADVVEIIVEDRSALLRKRGVQ